MGYYSDFEVTIEFLDGWPKNTEDGTGFCSECGRPKEVRGDDICSEELIKKCTLGYGGYDVDYDNLSIRFNLGEVKWYNCKNDITSFSKDYNCRVTVIQVGEDNLAWKHTAERGELKTLNGKMVFEE